MRTLLVLRHGKSDWDATFGSDEQRPLAKRGKDAAKRIGVFITNAGVAPDICLTSPAVRARDTLDLARKAGHWEASVHENRLLYEGGVSSIINLVRETDRQRSSETEDTRPDDGASEISLERLFRRTLRF